MFKPDIRAYAERELKARGVEIMLGERVASVEPTRVTLASGTVLPAHTLVWGAGLQASPIAGSLGIELEKGKRVAVDPELRLPSHPEVFAVGDIAWITDAKTGDVLPQLGSVALQAGEHAGKNIAKVVAGDEPRAVRVPRQGNDGGDRARRSRCAAARRTHDERKDGVPRVGRGPSHAVVGVGGPDEVGVDWTWSGFSHERAGRIMVGQKEEK